VSIFFFLLFLTEPGTLLIEKNKLSNNNVSTINHIFIELLYV
jgi:hypothetical protein